MPTTAATPVSDFVYWVWSPPHTLYAIVLGKFCCSQHDATAPSSQVKQALWEILLQPARSNSSKLTGQASVVGRGHPAVQQARKQAQHPRPSELERPGGDLSSALHVFWYTAFLGNTLGLQGWSDLVGIFHQHNTACVLVH